MQKEPSQVGTMGNVVMVHGVEVGTPAWVHTPAVSVNPGTSVAKMVCKPTD